MAVAFRADTEVTNTTRTNVTINKPTGTADGDVLIASIYQEDNSAVTLPSGWSTIYTTTPKTELQHTVCIKVASSEPASWTWEFPSTWGGGWVAAFSGADATTPQDATATQNSSTTGQTMTHLGITTVTNNAMLIAIATHWWAVAGTWGGPSGMTQHVVIDAQHSAYALQAAAGASGNKTTTTPETSDAWTAILIALRESGATPGGTKAPPPRRSPWRQWMRGRAA